MPMPTTSFVALLPLMELLVRPQLGLLSEFSNG
ncbi:hypothetical protein AAHE18_20G126700 [Arachis hypogaea]